MNQVPNTSEDLTALAERLAAARPDLPAGRFAGRGIVVCAGGSRVFTNAYVLLSLLRHTLNCTLPIEVWHFGAEEMSPSMAGLLAELDVEVVDALPRIAAEAAKVRDGWQLKPFAIQHSRFAEVLLLDADQVPVRNPVELFDWPEYRETGAVFWPDVVELRETNPIWAALGLVPRRTISLESGQVLIDKRRHWQALSVVGALNAEAERLYQMIYGDKDTFLIGWQLAEARFALVPHSPFSDERYLVQRDFSGAPLFQHRTNAKWVYAGAQHELEGFVHLEACRSAIATLRDRWNGRVFNLPDRSVAARALEAELLEAGPLLLDVLADETIRLELLPAGEIARHGGRANDRQNWWCEERPDGFDFVISDADRVTYRLRRLDRDNWEGLRTRVPEHVVTLRPAAAGDAAAASAPGLVDQLLRAAGYPHLSADAEAELRAALRLLCRVEPGAVRRLELLAAQSTGLNELLEAVAPPRQRDEVRRDMVLGRFYHFTSQND
ncbi:MAG TPA: hypothetical protein VGV07_24830 [Devosia sp.]|jgi:hypothetical protein|uniref:hypothetical protein n=1 Tax=Devosia sp. TaxID=1871048 RepID=UPI002DDDB188|nr:hypothetical protein [Devosia sp.]HEV2518496.1 hypothetical protein [Devosia sp.]